jgi:hypothetical protein
MATSVTSNQISNRNFLSPIGFKFNLVRYPKVSFFSNSAKIPELTMGVEVQPNYLNDIPVPGNKMTFGDFRLKFFVDEDMENYMIIHNWITALGGSGSLKEYGDLLKDNNGIIDEKRAFSDGSLKVLNSNYRDVATVRFSDLWPVSLTSLDFTAMSTDINYFTAEVVFKYTIYDILGANNKPLYPLSTV